MLGTIWSCRVEDDKAPVDSLVIIPNGVDKLQEAAFVAFLKAGVKANDLPRGFVKRVVMEKVRASWGARQPRVLNPGEAMVIAHLEQRSSL